MKINLKTLNVIILGFLLAFMACDTTEEINITSSDPEFELIQPAVSNINLNFNLPDNPAFTIVWNDELTDGSAGYMVELATDSDFTTPTTLGASTTDRFTMTVMEFNNAVIGAGGTAFEPFPVFMRVSTGALISNIVSFSVSSYAESNPVITNPDSSFSVILSDTTPNDEAINITWDDPDFGESSSVDVTYELQFVSGGNDFANAIVEGTDGMSYSKTHEEFNDIVLNAGLDAEEAGSLDFRVKATIEMDGGNMERFSETTTITVTPFSVELEPVLYVVGGGAVDAGWSWDSPVEFLLQGTIYSANINLTPENGGNFRFFAQQDWGPTSFNYLYYEDRNYTIDPNLVNAMDGDSNFQFIGTAGEYFLEIDTEAKTITLGPPVVGPNCEFDQLWLVGAGVPDAGWAWTSPVQLPCTGTGIYSGNVNLQNNGGADNNFRFFSDATLEWVSPSFNYPHYVNEGYTIDSDFVDAMDGDNNFAFVGTTGQYLLEIDTINKTITLDAPQTTCEYDQLWLVGAGVPDAGWAWTSPVQLPCTGDGVYSGSVTFANDSFRFFTDSSLEWASPSFNFPYYVSEGYTIDANFDNAMDGDSNFSFIGTPGTYTLTLDTVNKTITLN